MKFTLKKGDDIVKVVDTSLERDHVNSRSYDVKTTSTRSIEQIKRDVAEKNSDKSENERHIERISASTEKELPKSPKVETTVVKEPFSARVINVSLNKPSKVETFVSTTNTSKMKISTSGGYDTKNTESKPVVETKEVEKKNQTASKVVNVNFGRPSKPEKSKPKTPEYIPMTSDFIASTVYEWTERFTKTNPSLEDVVKEISEIEGTIQNEKLWEKAISYNPNIHTDNCIIQEKYLVILNDLKSDLEAAKKQKEEEERLQREKEAEEERLRLEEEERIRKELEAQAAKVSEEPPIIDVEPEEITVVEQQTETPTDNDMDEIMADAEEDDEANQLIFVDDLPEEGKEEHWYALPIDPELNLEEYEEISPEDYDQSKILVYYFADGVYNRVIFDKKEGNWVYVSEDEDYEDSEDDIVPENPMYANDDEDKILQQLKSSGKASLDDMI